VDLVESLSVTVAVNENVVLIGTEADVGVIATDLTVVDPELGPLLPHAENIRQAIITKTEPRSVHARLPATCDASGAGIPASGICWLVVIIWSLGSGLLVAQLQIRERKAVKLNADGAE
jgi:hypothetical protein